MLRVTADTNILVSSTIAEGNEYELLKLAKLGKVELVLSLQILKEFKEVISRPKFGFSKEQIDKALRQIMGICSLVMPSRKIHVLKDDPDDNMVLECAEAGKVDYIVSGDEHLLRLGRYKGMKIVRTKLVLDLVE